jgi:hypothetical protein
MTVSVAEGAYVDPSAGRVLFGAYAASWAVSQPHRASTAAGVESTMRAHILPTFGARPIASIRTSEVQAWVSGLDLAPSTVRVTYVRLKSILAAAVEDKIISRLPCTRSVSSPVPTAARSCR